MKHRIEKFLKKAAALTMILCMILEQGAVTAAAADTAVSGSYLYALKVSTGTANGDGISMFAIGYIDSTGAERTEYVMPFDGSLQDSLDQAAAAGSDQMKAKEERLQTLGYTIAGYDDLQPMRANSNDTFLITLSNQVQKVTKIDIITDVGTTGTNVSWDCEGLQFYKVSKLNGLDFNGYYSTQYEIMFDGTLLAESVFSSGKTSYTVTNPIGGDDTIVRVAPQSASFHLEDFYLKTYTDGEANAELYRDVYVELDLADIYGAGIEAFTNLQNSYGEVSTVGNWYLPEVLTLKIYYLNESGNGRTVTVPVVTSALAWALENTSAENQLQTTSMLADFMGQGEKILLKLRLYDYGSMNTSASLAANMVLSYNPENAASETGLTEIPNDVVSSRHANIQQQILTSKDSFSLTGIYFYDNTSLTDSDFGVTVQDGTILTCDPEKTPDYFYSAGSVDGVDIYPSSDHKNDTKYTLSDTAGKSLYPKNTKDNFIVVMKTANTDLAVTDSDLKLKLGYITGQGENEVYTDNYDVAELVRNYYGYWPATDGTNASYKLNMTAGGYLYCLVQLSGVSRFTSATLTLDGSDPWQLEDFYIYQVGDSLLSDRHVLWQQVKGNGVESDRLIYRKFNSVDITSGSTTASESSSDVTIGSAGGGINVSGLDSITLLQKLKQIDVYLDAKTPKKRIDFESGEVQKDVTETDWRDTGKISEMTYEDTQTNLGFSTRKQQYTIDVKVGTEAYETENGDPGSSNFFYFQLEFENGCSAYVQANQQLAADGFVAGQTAEFTVSTNYDYGELQAVNVIPDDSSSSANPYDKLKIDEISVTTTTDDNSTREWVCTTDSSNAWVGIDYVEEGASTSSVTTESRDASEIITTYTITNTTVKTPVLVVINTGSYGENSPQLQASELYADFNVTYMDGTNGKIPIDVLSYMYDFTGETPIENPDAAGVDVKKYLSNTDSMFRSGEYNCFILKLSNVKYINSVDLRVCSTEADVTWTVNDIALYRITADNGRKISPITGSYILDGTTEIIAHADRSELGLAAGWTNTLSPDMVKTYHIPFEKQVVCLENATTETYEQNREPTSHNDYLNVAVYMKKDGTDYSNCQVTDTITYSNSFDTYYRTSPTLKRTEINGQTVYYANSVGAKNITSIDSIYLSATFGDVDSMASLDYVVIQRIVSGVVIETYYFEGGDSDITLGLSFEATSRTKSGETVKNGDYQVVTLMLGDDTAERELSEDLENIAVSLRYTSSAGNDNTVYQTPFIYLTDQNITEVGSDQMIKLTFNQTYVKEIKGIEVAVTGKELYAYVESASVGVYTYTGEEEDTSVTVGAASDLKAGYECSAWYSIAAQKKLQAGSASFDVTDSVLGDYKAIVPMKVTFKTKDATKTVQDTGLTSDAKVRLIFFYTGEDGNAYTREFENILDYAENTTAGSFTTGSTDVVAFMEQNMNTISGILIQPYDDNSAYVQNWGIESVTFSYGDGAGIADKTIVVDETAYENGENVTKYDGLYIGIKNVPVTINVDSVCGTAYSSGEKTAKSGDSTETAVRIDQVNGSVEFTINTSNTTQGVRVIASRDSLADSSGYLSTTGGSTLKFTPPSEDLTQDVTYTIRAYANENPSCAAELKVVVGAGLHNYTCTVSTTDIKQGDGYAVFDIAFSDAPTEDSTVTVDVNGSPQTTILEARQKTATLKVPLDDDFYGTVSAKVTAVAGNNGGLSYTPTSNTAVCNVEATVSADVTLSADAENVREGESMKFTLQLSQPALEDMTVTVNISNGTSGSTPYSVNIRAGASSGTLSVGDAQIGTWTATVGGVTGGGFDKVNYAAASASCTVSGVTLTLKIDDYTENDGSNHSLDDTGEHKLILELTESSDVTMTVQLHVVKMTVSVDPVTYAYSDTQEVHDISVAIPAGQSKVEYTFDYGDEVFGASTVTYVSITGVSTGSFKNLHYSTGTFPYTWR